MTSEKQAQKFHTDLGGAFYWSCRLVNLIQPIRSATQIWVVALHQYRISTLISQTSFGGKPVVASLNVGCVLRLISNLSKIPQFSYLTLLVQK